MISWIVQHTPQWNSWLALLLYWLPLALCAYGYTVRSVKRYSGDLARRAKAEKEERAYYVPSETLGSLLGRAIMTVLPVGNLFAAIFNVAPEVFGDFFDWLGRVFSQPLVPERTKDTQP